ncbi:MAG: SPOR domain-containing protein, partial [Pseudomonadota bacterium]
ARPLRAAPRPAAPPGAAGTLIAALPAGKSQEHTVAKVAAAVELALASQPPVPAAANPAPGALIPLAARPTPRPGLFAQDRATQAKLSPGSTVPVPTIPVAPAALPVDNRGAWVVQLGGTHNRSNGERLLLQAALQEMEALEGSKREMLPTGSPGWYRARFVGLSKSAAQAACARLAARQTPCEVISGG